MIIVKTKNGSVLINERETHVVQHMKDKKMVIVRSDKDKMNASIHEVEGISYTNDAHDTKWQEEGSMVERLHKEMHILELDKKEWDIIASNFRWNALELRNKLEAAMDFLNEEQRQDAQKTLNDIDYRMDKAMQKLEEVRAEREEIRKQLDSPSA